MIQKRVVGAPASDNPSFVFNRSISFDPNGFTGANDSRCRACSGD